MTDWSEFTDAALGVQVCVILTYVTIVSFFIFMLVVCVVGLWKLQYRRKRFYDSLTDEHDKAIVGAYRNIDVGFAEIFKKDKE